MRKEAYEMPEFVVEKFVIKDIISSSTCPWFYCDVFSDCYTEGACTGELTPVG